MKQLLNILVLTGLFVIPSAFAEVELKSDFKGTVIITDPTGKIAMLEAGDPVPVIANKSTIEVFEGLMVISVGEGEEVVSECSGNQLQLSGPGSIQLECGETGGKVQVIQGILKGTDHSQNAFELRESEERVLASAPTDETAAPATAAGEEIGAPLEGNRPVDSRSIQTNNQTSDSSPSQ